jgi:hypothetical protein
MHGYEGHAYCYVSADMTSLDLNCLTLKVKALRSYETSGTACQRTHRNIPEYWNLQGPHISHTCLEASTFLHFYLHFHASPVRRTSALSLGNLKQRDALSTTSPEVTVCVASRLRVPDAYSAACFVSLCLSFQTPGRGLPRNL